MANRIDDGFRTTICFSCPPSLNNGINANGNLGGWILNTNGVLSMQQGPPNSACGGTNVITPLAPTTPLQFGGVILFEKTVTPSGYDGGGANDVTTMRNYQMRTMSPKKLKTATDLTAVIAYDPAVYPYFVGFIQVNQMCTVTWPDNSKLSFWGWLDKFIPGDLTEGSQPTATITVTPSNHDNCCPPNEVVPLYRDGTASTCLTCVNPSPANNGVCSAGTF